MADTKEAEKKEEAKGPVKHKLPEGMITPVEAYHRLQKEINPDTGQPYADSKLTSQQVYTLLNAAAKNGMPVHHVDAAGHRHKTVQTKTHEGGHVEVLTRPGFDWDELAAWWPKRPTRASKASSTEEKPSDNGAQPESASAEAASHEATEADELAELEGDDDIVEAE